MLVRFDVGVFVCVCVKCEACVVASSLGEWSLICVLLHGFDNRTVVLFMNTRQSIFSYCIKIVLTLLIFAAFAAD